jgi:hypothetical protein
MCHLRAHFVALLVLLALSARSQPQSSKASAGCQSNSNDLNVALKCAEEDEAEGNLEDAIEGFESLSNDKADIDPRIRNEATSNLMRARRQLRKKRQSFLELAWERVIGFVRAYLIPLLVLGAFVAFRIAVNVFPRRGIEISLSDLGADSDKASTYNQSLNAELLFLLEDPEPLAVRGLQMNTMPGTGQPAFGVIRPVQAMTLAPEFSSSKHPVKLGAFEFRFDDIAQLISRLFRIPSAGTVTSHFRIKALLLRSLSRR